MNIVQLIRRSRLGVDAILPGGNVSAQWTDEEMVTVANAAYDETWRMFRLARKKWGQRTMTNATPVFTMDGETYDPTVQLVIPAATSLGAQVNVLLPPDFGDLVRVTCLNQPLLRFRPAETETLYWLEREQETLIPGAFDTLMYFYDIVGARTMRVVPQTSTGLNLSIEYIPLRRPLYFSVAGTVSQATTVLTGAGTKWLTDSIATEDTGNQAELIIGTNSPTSSIINTNKDYPRIAAIASDTIATMVLSGTVAAGTTAIVAMAPALPRDTHRWISDYTSAFMLKKVNPELSMKYMEEVLARMEKTIQPIAVRRQLQESPVTEGIEEFHSITHKA